MRLGLERGDLTVLVDGNNKSRFCRYAREPAQREKPTVPTHDHGLSATPRLDPKPLRDSLRDVGVERG